MRGFVLKTSRRGDDVKIRFGYELVYGVPQQTPMIFTLHCQPQAGQQLLRPDIMCTSPVVPLSFHPDVFGNTCTRLEAPPGLLRLTALGVMEDCGWPEPAHWAAAEYAVRDLPADTLQYLLASRYCETDLLMNEAWRLFGHLAPGWSRVQAICDFVNREVAFGYQFARPTKTALETFRERQGVCRDMAHLAISFCRISPPAWRCSWVVHGMSSIRGTTPAGSAASSSRAGVTPATWRSVRPLGRRGCKLSGYGPTRSRMALRAGY
jgi:transglutaminase-like putative cysteine protease